MFAEGFTHGVVRTGNNHQFKILVGFDKCIDYLHGRGKGLHCHPVRLPPTSADGSTDGRFPHSNRLCMNRLSGSPSTVRSTRSYPYGCRGIRKLNRRLCRTRDVARRRSMPLVRQPNIRRYLHGRGRCTDTSAQGLSARLCGLPVRSLSGSCNTLPQTLSSGTKWSCRLPAPR